MALNVLVVESEVGRQLKHGAGSIPNQSEADANELVPATYESAANCHVTVAESSVQLSAPVVLELSSNAEEWHELHTAATDSEPAESERSRHEWALSAEFEHGPKHVQQPRASTQPLNDAGREG